MDSCATGQDYISTTLKGSCALSPTTQCYPTADSWDSCATGQDEWNTPRNYARNPLISDFVADRAHPLPSIEVGTYGGGNRKRWEHRDAANGVQMRDAKFLDLESNIPQLVGWNSDRSEDGEYYSASKHAYGNTPPSGERNSGVSEADRYAPASEYDHSYGGGTPKQKTNQNVKSYSKGE